MTNHWLVKGEAVEEVAINMLKNEDCISQIEWDMFAEGITTVCIFAETDVEAVEIAKKCYGFQSCSVERA